MGLSVLGIGTVSALGSGVDTLRRGLQGKIQPNIEEKNISLAKGDYILPVYVPVVEGLDRFIPKRSLRRIDRFARQALLSAYLAVEDAGVEFADKSRVGVIFGSGYGPTRTTFKFLDNIIDDGDFGASPTHFANSVHNALASQVSIFLGLTGPCSTVTCFEYTLSNVMVTAQDWLDQDIVDYVLVGLGDEYCDVLGYAAAGMDAGKEKNMRPLDFENCTYLPGEGHITFLVSNAGTVNKKYADIEEIGIRYSIDQTQNSISNKPVIINASGRLDQAPGYSGLGRSHMLSYTGLYGGMPTASAFDIAVACLSLKDKILYPMPGVEGKEADLNEAIMCLEYCRNDEFNVYRLKS
jgi:3-oxoacyl-[acyl-carrier-protein] synthase II